MNAQSAPVPVIDLTAATPQALVQALQQASCVFLVGHGIPRAWREAVLDSGDRFFALPRAEKEKVQWPGDGPWYGWQPVSEAGPTADLMERYELRLARGQSHLPLQEWADGFSHWPQEPVEFRTAWARFYAAMHALAARLTTMIGDGLSLPASDLRAWTTEQHSNLVLNHFHAQHQPPAPGRLRAAAHTDIGGLTLLWADDAPGGLEAAIGENGAWVPVSFREDIYLLQAGDLLHVWSGGRIPANRHRVVNPPPGTPPSARRSLVFFHHPNPDIWVAPVVGEGAGISAVDHIMTRQRGEYSVINAPG